MEIPLEISLADTSHFLRCSSMESFQETPEKKNLFCPLQFYNTLHYNIMLHQFKTKKKKKKEVMRKKKKKKKKNPKKKTYP